MNILLIAAGGFVGGASRYLLARALRTPRGTLVANVLGALIIGGVVGTPLPEWAYWLLGTGLAGGLSTWSTLAQELGQLLKQKRYYQLFSYAACTLTLGLLAAWVAAQLGVQVGAG